MIIFFGCENQSITAADKFSGVAWKNDNSGFYYNRYPETGTVEQRARAWLDVNCAHCHNPLGSARTSGLDLSIGQIDPVKFGIYKSPVAAGKGSGGRRYDIIPGKPDESIMMYRLESEDVGARMPNLARNKTFHAANDLIREWILQMPIDDAKPKNRR